jgi:hypothetical protein
VSARIWMALVAVCLVGGGLAGCQRTPTEAYIDMSTAAQMGDLDGFLSGFTEESRALVKSLTTLSEAYGMTKSNPYELLVFDSVDEEIIKGDEAELVVRTRGNTRKILMVREEDEWRIDTKRLDAYWQENR